MVTRAPWGAAHVSDFGCIACGSEPLNLLPTADLVELRDPVLAGPAVQLPRIPIRVLQVCDIDVVAYGVDSVRPRGVRLASHLYQELAWVEPKTRQFALEILFYTISE